MNGNGSQCVDQYSDGTMISTVVLMYQRKANKIVRDHANYGGHTRNTVINTYLLKASLRTRLCKHVHVLAHGRTSTQACINVFEPTAVRLGVVIRSTIDEYKLFHAV